MKVTSNTVYEILSQLRVYFHGDSAIRNNDNQEPFRSELYNSEQMNLHGKVVARSHKLLKRNSSDKLIKRLDDNEKTLLEVRNMLVDDIRAGKAITPAAEWLLDNFYLIEEQIIIARKHFPKKYNEGLPYLAKGVSMGMPRVYDIVLEIISHSDGRVDEKNLSSFVAAYQTHNILTLGELWAIPIMLRLAVIENIRRAASKIAMDMIDRNMADYWADKMVTTTKEEPGNLILIIADMARSKPVLAGPFVAELARKLQGNGPALVLPISWVEQQLSGLGTSINEIIGQENQKQAADQVSVRNSIGTLRFIGAVDWREFVETLSSVEQILRQDVANIYRLMDFATRDRYRHVVESVAKASSLSETEVARKVLELAAMHKNDKQNADRYAHIGYYLIDKGLIETERACNMHFSLKHRIKHIVKKAPVFLYLLSISLVTTIGAMGTCYMAFRYGIHSSVLLIIVGLLSISGAAQLAVSLVNWLSTIWVHPKLLPRMDFSKGIPDDCLSLVVVPTMLTSKAYIEDQIEKLEIRFLANKEANLHFGLLTDFPDADTETKPDDDSLLKQVRDGIKELNEKYQHDIFFLFHRSRVWNEKQQKWMGYERKRGKLSAFNAFLRGRDHGEFSSIIGNFNTLSKAKYVITLDSDTQLPREAVWKFIATMAHPLNHAIYDRKQKRVVEGYGILQPRVGSSIPKSDISLYSRMQGNVSGIDPYTKVSSDVYQDLFGEGSFIGKGIYDIDIFEQSVNQVFQENRILSHDLLEGCYSRSGLLSDVLLYEDYPSQYEADIKRHHRWIRGDWQIGSWILPFVPDHNGHLIRNQLSALSRWKILDNLRRSVLSLSLLLLLLIGWTVLPFPWFWTSVITVIILLPVLAEAGWQLIHKPTDLTMHAHLSEVGVSIRDILIRFMFGIAVLPYEAYKNTDAIIRTVWRMVVSKKNLLEWVTSATVQKNETNRLWPAYKEMWVAPTLSIICISLFFYNYHYDALFVAAPILVLWLAAPWLAWRLSKPEPEENAKLSEEQMLFLHKSARKTWAYFERFVNVDENWLPPDNFQEEPALVIAHRTSPTNMGLALLSNLSAYDFGYITGTELAQRCSDTLKSMYKLERYKGHFYNWYDTIFLLPMLPRYVSTVDTGNLLGHLFTLRQGLLSLPHKPIFDVRGYSGLHTTLALSMENLKKHHVELAKKIELLLETAADNDNTLSRAKSQLDELVYYLNQIKIDNESIDNESHKWIKKLSSQIERIQEELTQLMPWVKLAPVPQRFVQLGIADQISSLQFVRDLPNLLLGHIDSYEKLDNSKEESEWLMKMRECLLQGSNIAKQKIMDLEQIAVQCEQLCNVEYDFLFDEATNLIRIGYNVEEQRKDNSFYDLLASEARLGVFVGISQGQLPQESWFALGRLLTNSGGDPILLSWSGSMFEYLMPQLVMPSYDNTLLSQTNKATVKRQIDYAGQRGIPWGISESAYNNVDANLNYQYRAFGVPGIGLKRGLEEDLVIAPYATMLALMVSPLKACINLQVLAKEGFEGEYGFFEAIDYTISRLPRNKPNSIVRSYMVHHQGMSLLSMAYLLLNKPMQQRFISELRFQATLLLLQERIPRATVFYAHTADIIETHTISTDIQVRNIVTPNTAIPEMQLLSNGRYHVMITNSGGGYSRWKDIAVTRWREDTTEDNRGTFCYIKDISTGQFWSNTYQPTLHPVKGYVATFSQGRAEFHRQDYGMETRTEIVVSPEDDVEMRRIRITNRTLHVKVLEITSYAEVVLASQASDESHPAFSNLFVQTEINSEYKAVFCTRRPRSENDAPPWMFHLMDVHGVTVETISYETDRMQFIGRGKTLANPQAMHDDVLSGKQGSVLDPIAAIRYRITIKPNQKATIDLTYGIGETKVACQALMHKYYDQHLKNRAFELSWTHSQVFLRQINATEADTQLYDRLAASVIYANPAMRADPSVILNNFRGQSGLWSHSVSGDLPIVLLHIHDPGSIDLIRQMIQAHAYWRLKGLLVDLVIWNEDYGSYRQVLQEQILGLITAEEGTHPVNKPGNIYVKSADQISSEDRVLFESVARIIIHDTNGTLPEQVNRHYIEKVLPPFLEPKKIKGEDQNASFLHSDLVFFNGKGGFTSDGKEYKIITDKNSTTPAPWVNIIANPDFGTVVSESGSAYTWAINAHEYRITPWSNDPVTDNGGEAFYLRDEDTGHFWSPSPYPVRGTYPYITTHGFGYSMFEHIEQDIASEMLVFVDKALPVKFIILKIKNLSGHERKLSVTGLLEIILGDLRSKTNMHILSEIDMENKALLLRNRYNTTFTDRITFFSVNGANISYTTDRSEFIGRNRSLGDPQAMYRSKLSGRIGAGMDPCAALQVKFDLLEGEEKEIIFQIGNEKDIHSVKNLIGQFLDKDSVMQSLQNVKSYWSEILSAVQINTPDKSLNILANGWLMYQTIACRIFARSGFYQSGGAFGFRDQLQDVLAVLYTRPDLARGQILLNASRQFVEGDVQHWWHAPEGRGVRTHCSDDLLWLPFVVSKYIIATGDTGILDMQVGYLESRALYNEEDSLYDLPVSGNLSGSLYEHCVRAIHHSSYFGKHGLPLMGSGDWNDGMDKVGNKGQGESVWLAFFLYDILVQFADIATIHGDIDFTKSCKQEAIVLQANIEAHGWDGEWYLRAFFDDGTPLGSQKNTECRIDAIAQSWSVLSNAAPANRRMKAMKALDQNLVKRDIKLIQLLDPPFDSTSLNPGYVKGYVPGVRENGGQYSHAAIWTLMAFAKLADREKVWELLDMVNPLNHAMDPASMQVYKVEPYVMAADVYASEAHKGRGGWTWYTGSSGWMYQFIIGPFLGMEQHVDTLTFKPCFPIDWPSVSITYRYRRSVYNITIFQLHNNTGTYWKMGDKYGKGNSIKLVDDEEEHDAEIYIQIAK